MLSLLALSCAAAPTNAVSPYLPSGTNLTQEEIAASHEAYFKSPRKPEFMPRPAELYGEDVKSNFIESTRRGIRFNDVPDGVEVRFRNGTTIIKGDTNSLNVRAHCYKLVWCDPTPLNPNCDPTYTVGCQVKEMRVNPTLDYIEDPAWGHYRVVQKASYGSTSMTINHGITVEDTWSVSLNVGFELEGATTGASILEPRSPLERRLVKILSTSPLSISSSIVDSNDQCFETQTDERISEDATGQTNNTDPDNEVFTVTSAFIESSRTASCCDGSSRITNTLSW
ncbi:hypothetical protein EDD86DRAFT_216426 [Gorgonomyces haynaldii]|nr:hypothetical protein EDD86DRAFT_216426 [Gorgonomyces haynaldii]